MCQFICVWWLTQQTLKNLFLFLSLSRLPPSHSLISSRHQPHPSVIFNHLIKHASNQFHQSKCIKQHDFQFAFVSVLVLNLYRFAIVLSNSISFHSQCDFYWLNIFWSSNNNDDGDDDTDSIVAEISFSFGYAINLIAEILRAIVSM